VRATGAGGTTTVVTTAGRAVALLGGLLLVLATRSRAPGLYPLAALLLAALPVAWLQRTRLDRLDVRVAAGAALVVPVGTEVAVALSVGWRGPGAAPPLRLSGVFDDRLAVQPLVLQPGGDRHRATLRALARRRGHHRDLLLTITDGGVLGLLERRRRLDLPLDLVVAPRWRALPDRLPLGARGEDASALPAPLGLTRGTEPRGTRGYRTGDEPRAVHWRASARAGRLTVREWDPPRAAGLALVVQLAPDSAAPVLPERPSGSGADADEELLEAVASVGLGALREGRPVALLHARAASAQERASGAYPAGAAVVDRRTELSAVGLLTALAEVEPLRTPLPELLGHACRSAGTGGIVLLAAGVGWGLWTTAELRAAEEEVRRRGAALHVLLGRTADGPVPPGAAEAFADLAARVPVTLASSLLAASPVATGPASPMPVAS